MQRWHLTVGLGALVLGVAAIAPQLSGKIAVEPAIPAPPPVIDTVVEPIVDLVPTGLPVGHLSVDVGLDRTALLRNSDNERFLTITLGAPDDLGESFRRPVDLAVVMDTSGSMTARGKIDYAKRGAKLLATEMQEGDLYSLVVFSEDAKAIVPATPVYDPAAVHDAIDRVLEGGGTNLYAGIEKGASEIHRTIDDDHTGRIVILSDGKATAGITDPAALERYVAELSSRGMSVSAIGLGAGDYNEDLLARIADIGGGTYDFVDDPRDLDSAFADELDRTASVIARDTTLTIDLPSGVRALDVVGWEASRTATGLSLRVGDVYAGETRKIVVRVQVDAATADNTLDIASVHAEYHDLVDGRRAATDATTAASITDNRAVVASSVDRARSIDANAAWGNFYLDQSTRAYANGDVEEAKKLALEGERVLRDAGRELDADELKQDADNTVRQTQIYSAYSPSSTRGQTAIKAAKEHARNRARR